MNFSNLKVSDLHDPNLVHIYSLYMDISFIIATVCYVTMLYVIFTKSNKSIQSYKYLLINQLSCSYFVEFTFSFLQPIVLLPFITWYSAGIAGSLGPNMVYFMTNLFIIVALGFAHAIVFSLAFRLVMIKAQSWWHKWFNTKKFLVMMHVTTVVPLLMFPLSKSGD